MIEREKVAEWLNNILYTGDPKRLEDCYRLADELLTLLQREGEPVAWKDALKKYGRGIANDYLHGGIGPHGETVSDNAETFHSGRHQGIINAIRVLEKLYADLAPQRETGECEEGLDHVLLRIMACDEVLDEDGLCACIRYLKPMIVRGGAFGHQPQIKPGESVAAYIERCQPPQRDREALSQLATAVRIAQKMGLVFSEGLEASTKNAEAILATEERDERC